MSDIIYLSNVRLSFPHLIEPQRKISPETGKERVSYSADLIMPPDHAGFKQFMAKVVAAQTPGGWWVEHSGPVVAYNFVYVEALGIYYAMSRDAGVLELFFDDDRLQEIRLGADTAVHVDSYPWQLAANVSTS
jgi:hypothetical protein